MATDRHQNPLTEGQLVWIQAKVTKILPGERGMNTVFALTALPAIEKGGTFLANGVCCEPCEVEPWPQATLPQPVPPTPANAEA